jgi:hypothetical protein
MNSMLKRFCMKTHALHGRDGFFLPSAHVQLIFMAAAQNRWILHQNRIKDVLRFLLLAMKMK